MSCSARRHIRTRVNQSRGMAAVPPHDGPTRDEPLSAFGADSRTIGSHRPDAADHDNTVI
jgi:hypothetical protein